MPAWIRKRETLWLALALIVALFATLWPMPKRTFVVGDPGVRLLFIESFWQEGRGVYLGVRYPAKPFDPQQLLAPTFLFWRVGERILPAYPLLFPLASAPWYWLLGALGLYVLPLLCGLGIGLLTCQIARLFAPRWAAVAGLLTVLASPVLVYSVEFWDHTPSVLLALAALYTLITGLEHGKEQRLFFSGLCAGLAVAVRPEMYMFALLLPAVGWLVWHPKWRTLGRCMLSLLLVLVALWLSNASIFRHPLGGQMALNSPSPQNVIGWYREMRLKALWAILPSAGGWSGAIVYATGAFLALAAWLRPPKWRRALAWATWLWLLGAGVWLSGVLWRGEVNRDIGRTFPFILALLAMMALTRFVESARPAASASARFRRALALIAAGYFLLVLAFLIADDYQWGARYWMPLYPLLAALGAGAWEDLLAVLPGWKRVFLAAVVALFALLSVGMQSVGWRTFYRNKSIHEQVIRLIESSPAEVIVAGEWWMPQVYASIYYERLFLTWNPQVSGAALRDVLERSGTPSLVTISTTFPGAPDVSRIPLDETHWRLTARATVADWIVLRFYER